MNERARSILQNILLIIGGVAIAVVIVLLALPYVLPSRANQETEVEYTVGMGDIFVFSNVSVAPPDSPDEILSRHTLRWDENGFRLPETEADMYPIIAVGDSITEAMQVEFPYTDVIVRELEIPVQNLGYQGYGPLEEAQAVIDYVVPANPEILIVAYFGANDLSNVRTAQNRQDEGGGLLDLVRDVVGEPESEPWLKYQAPYIYPVQVELGGELHDIAFLDGYITWLNLEAVDLLRSRNYAGIIESWNSIDENFAGENQCVIIAYFPSKAEVYLRYVVPESREVIFTGVSQRTASHGDWLWRNDDPDINYETWLSRKDTLRTALARDAGNLGFSFLDLTEPFESAAQNGEMLFYTYDTHMNQAGHDLAGRIMGEVLTESECLESR